MTLPSIGYYLGGNIIKSAASQVVTFGIKAAIVESFSKSVGQGKVATAGAKLFNRLSKINVKSLIGGLSVSTVLIGIGCGILALTQPHLALALLIGYVALGVIFGGTVWISKTYYATKEMIKSIIDTLISTKNTLGNLIEKAKNSMHENVQEARESLAKEMGELRGLLHDSKSVQTVNSINEEKKKFEVLINEKKKVILEKFSILQKAINENTEKNEETTRELNQKLVEINGFGKDKDENIMGQLNKFQEIKDMTEEMRRNLNQEIQNLKEKNTELTLLNQNMQGAVNEIELALNLMEGLDTETTRIFALWESCLPNVEISSVNNMLLALQNWLSISKDSSNQAKEELAITLVDEYQKIGQSRDHTTANLPGDVVLKTVQVANATRDELTESLNAMIEKTKEGKYDFTLDKTVQEVRQKRSDSSFKNGSSFKNEVEEGVLPVLRENYKKLENSLILLKQKKKERQLEKERQLRLERELKEEIKKRIEQAKAPVIQVANAAADYLEQEGQGPIKQESLDKEKEMSEHLMRQQVSPEALKGHLAFKKRMEKRKYDQTLSGQFERGITQAQNAISNLWSFLPEIKGFMPSVD